MSEFVKNYEVGIKVLTPLHVGAGAEKSWAPGADYYRDGETGEVYVIDYDKLYEKTDERQRAQWMSALESPKPNEFFNYLRNTLKIDFKSVSAHVFELPEAHPEGNIKTQLRTGLGKPLLPGSSIKGAVRSVLFNALRPRLLADKDNPDKEVFGQIDNNIMRLLRIGDAHFKHTGLFAAKIYNLHLEENDWLGGWKHKNSTTSDFSPKEFTTTYEVIKSGAKSSCRFSFASGIFELVKKTNRNILHSNAEKLMRDDPLEHLFGLANAWCRAYIERELAFFNCFENDDNEAIIEEYERLLSLIPPDNSACILRIGAGGGFHGITGDWKYADHTNTGFNPNGKKRYKSRKLVFEDVGEDGDYDFAFYPLGFVKFSRLR